MLREEAVREHVIPVDLERVVHLVRVRVGVGVGVRVGVGLGLGLGLGVEGVEGESRERAMHAPRPRGPARRGRYPYTTCTLLGLNKINRD